MSSIQRFQKTKYIFKKKDMNIQVIHMLPFTTSQFQELKEMQEREDQTDQLVTKELMVRKEMMDHKVKKVREDQEEIKDQLERLEIEVIEAQEDQEVRKVIRENKDIQENKDQ